MVPIFTRTWQNRAILNVFMETSKKSALVQYIQLKSNNFLAHILQVSDQCSHVVLSFLTSYSSDSQFLFFLWFHSKFDIRCILCKTSANYRSLQGTGIKHSLVEDMMRTLGDVTGHGSFSGRV